MGVPSFKFLLGLLKYFTCSVAGFTLKKQKNLTPILAPNVMSSVLYKMSHVET